MKEFSQITWFGTVPLFLFGIATDHVFGIANSDLIFHPLASFETDTQ